MHVVIEDAVAGPAQRVAGATFDPAWGFGVRWAVDRGARAGAVRAVGAGAQLLEEHRRG